MDGKTFYEIYDSLSYNNTYADGALKGKDRYYSADEVVYSVQNYNDEYIVAHGK